MPSPVVLYSSGSAVLEDLGEAAVVGGHDRLAGAELDHLAHGHDAVLVLVELVADELLGLEQVGRHDARLGAHRLTQRLAVGVEHGRHVELAQLTDEPRVDVGLHAAGDRAGEHEGRFQVEEQRVLRLALADCVRPRLGVSEEGVDLRVLEHRPARGRGRERGRGRASASPTAAE